jgi:Protein ENHANCED DISEASE RESISTANCE 2, C-terminal
VSESSRYLFYVARTNALLGGQLRAKPTLAVNFRFPWGYMNLYFEVPAKLAVYLSNNENVPSITSVLEDASLTTAERTLALWLLGDASYKNERLKLIPYVAQGPWVVRNMVTGRPAIIGKKLPVSYQSFAASSTTSGLDQSRRHPLLMATLDIGNSSATAQRIVSVCRRYMSALTVDIGLVIQGTSPTELPEQMMGAMRVHGPDPGSAPIVR